MTTFQNSNLPPSELIQLYRKMVLIRGVEEALGIASKAGELPGPVHLYIGEEAIAAGVCAHLGDDDWITSTHRGHGHYLAKGGDVRMLVHEVYGRATGVCAGMGGSMHVADFSKGIVGANGIVGAGIPLAVGAALSAQLKGQRAVSVAFFGDGAANQGVLMEALNIAALWRLPLVFICENNGFSEFSPSRTVTAGQIVRRAEPFDVPGIVVDGNNVVDVWQISGEAIARARDGVGPTLIEAHTYRLRGHVEYEHTFLSRPYRTEAELAEHVGRDPVVLLRQQLLAAGLSDAILALEADLQAEIDAAITSARTAPWPTVSQVQFPAFAS